MLLFVLHIVIATLLSGWVVGRYRAWKARPDNWPRAVAGKLNTGDVVMLLGGGPIMTVTESYSTYTVGCTWLPTGADRLHTQQLAPGALKVKPRP